MAWNEPGGNGNDRDPWTGKNKGSGKNDAEELLNNLNKKLGTLFGGSGNGNNNDSDSGNGGGLPTGGILLLGILAFVGWIASGIYTVGAAQQALVLQFGEYKSTAGPGLHWHPRFIQTIEMIDVDEIRNAGDRSTMLTKDENIVDVEVTVQYRINDIEDYAFNVLLADNQTNQTIGTLHQTMRSAIREIVGRSTMDDILGESREQIPVDTQKLMQEILDSYKAGLLITKVNMTYAEAPEQVKDAFDDVNRAREDSNRFMNEAESYSNKVIPEARGRAARLIEEANAYKDQTVARSEGDAARFSQLVAEYRKAPEVTRERLYLESMETVLGGTRKVLIDSNSNNLLYLPLDGAANGGNANNIGAAAASRLGASMNGLSNSATTTNGISSTERSSRTLNAGSTRESR